MMQENLLKEYGLYINGEWRPAQQRAEILNKIADIIDANAVHLAKVESMDNGKPFRETSGIDIPMSADHFRYFAAAIRTQEGTATMLDNH